MKQRIAFALLLTLLATFFVAACRSENAATDTAANATATAPDTASATHPGSPGGTALVPDVAAGTTVLVVLEDNSLALPGQPIPPGPAVITIENRGTTGHNLFIDGEGINRAADDMVAAGASGTLDVVFKPGTYTFYCPVLDHRTKGESATVTITP
ncbi:MAG TPA: hypothetical protein VEK79_23240 [Thermoanaerobaculia bacterium]|nr:hypothetical protein [Thermoanaerobaculia bacterium]